MITGIHHATFLSSDLARSRAFYEGVLDVCADAKRPHMDFDGIWYDITPNQQIHLMALPDPEQGLLRPQHGGRDRHVALGVSDIEELKGRLKRADVAHTVSQSRRRAVFCRDPDGNALEFIEVRL